MLALIAAMFVFASVGWASNANCGTASFATISVNSNPGAPTQGCYVTDDTFSQFNVTYGSSAGGNTDTSQTDTITGTSTFSAVSTPWTETATFAASSASQWATSGSSSVQNQGTVNMIVNSTEAAFTVPKYNTPDAGDQVYFNTLGLAASGSTGTSSSDAITIVETYCIGAAACTASDQVTITATYTGGGATSPTFACVAGATSDATCTSATGSTASFAGGSQVTTLNVTDQYVISGSGGNSLGSIANSFGDFEGPDVPSPEPSTFILLGSALAGLGLVRLRRKKA
jgi:hypothetical protein